MTTLIADALGNIFGKFTIPANIPAGTKAVNVLGTAGSKAGASFTGDNTLTTVTQQRVVTTYLIYYDPLAQTFTLTAPEQIKAIEIFVVAKGTRPMRVQLRETAYGVPTQVVLAEAILPAASITPNAWNRFPFVAPVALPANVEYAMVVMSDEATPSVGIAQLGAYDSTNGRWVTSQPYQVGVLLSSSNASTWTPNQDRDLAFRIIGSRYTESSRLFDLGTLDVVGVTDLLLQGLIESPVQGATGSYQLTMPDGSVTNVGNAQVVSLSTPITGKVGVKALVTATASHSGVLHPGTFVAQGTLSPTGDYVTTAITADATGANIRVVYDAIIPSGATVRAFYQGIDIGDAWTELTQDAAPVPLGDGLYEYSFKADAVKEAQVRIRLALAGTAAARPRVRDLRITVL